MQGLHAEGLDYHIVRFGGECSVPEIESLVAEGRRLGARTVLGCGGGKVR